MRGVLLKAISTVEENLNAERKRRGKKRDPNSNSPWLALEAIDREIANEG